MTDRETPATAEYHDTNRMDSRMRTAPTVPASVNVSPSIMNDNRSAQSISMRRMTAETVIDRFSSPRLHKKYATDEHKTPVNNTMIQPMGSTIVRSVVPRDREGRRVTSALTVITQPVRETASAPRAIILLFNTMKNAHENPARNTRMSPRSWPSASSLGLPPVVNSITPTRPDEMAIFVLPESTSLYMSELMIATSMTLESINSAVLDAVVRFIPTYWNRNPPAFNMPNSQTWELLK